MAANLGELLAATCRVSNRLLARKVGSESDRSYVQLRALRILLDEDVGTQAALAERLLMDAPSVSRLVDRLENDGLLKRCEGENRRCVKLAITAAGKAEVEPMRRAIRWLDAEARRHLDAQEQRVFAALLNKLNDGLRDEAAAASIAAD